MKKFIAVCILLISHGISAQGIQDITQVGEDNAHVPEWNRGTGPSIANPTPAVIRAGFLKTARDHGIPIRQFSGLTGVANGYYLITGVYSELKYAERHVKRLNKKDFDANFLTNPLNHLNYVYLQYHTNGLESIDASTNLKNNGFRDEIWIMEVVNSAEASVPEQAMRGALLPVGDIKTSGAATTGPETVSTPGNEDPTGQKVLQKADLYFDRMWYAEAAELYEMAYSRGENARSYKVIRKAGESHYYNTDMEGAFKWYDLLYDHYRQDMTAEDFFKYANASKGVGKYVRAKRIMRTYDKARETGMLALNSGNAEVREVLLDNIRNAPLDFEIRNLPLNSEYSDFAPMFYNGDEVVFASAMDSSFFKTRRYKWNNQPYLDLYVARVDQGTGEVRNTRKFSKKINTKYHEASVTFSPDNKTIYFTRNNYGKKLKRDKRGNNNLKIYMSKMVDGAWTEAEELPFNSDSYSTGHPALTPDGKQLYFVSDMPGSIGLTDLFVVDVLEDGRFSEPRNLGPEINTERREMFPFINDRKLYFSSDGHVGLGGLDVYEVAFDGEQGFLEVRNMGQPVNSNVDDFSFIINEETQTGYFASNRKGGRGDDDIYSFKRIVKEPVIQNVIAGTVTEQITGQTLSGAVVTLTDGNQHVLKEITTGDDGNFVFEDLDSNTKYLVKTVKGSYFDSEKLVETGHNETVTADVNLKKLKDLIVTEDGVMKLKTDMIYFDFDKSYIRKDAAVELKKLVDVMTEYKDMVIKIESHTDSRGNNAYNKYLSNKRAISTRDYLISQGIAGERIESAIGYGEEHLLNQCDGSVRCSSEQHQRNRRSEFIIVRK